MRCLSPRRVGFLADGKTISWSQKEYSKEYSTFLLPCSKCIECRLEYARSWSVRCMHEAKMHEDNSFITLTYSDEYVGDFKLHYEHFQKFMKRLRFAYPNNEIGFFVTGEYGDTFKRPHWHALIFGWRPSDCEYKYSNGRGDRIFNSEVLNNLWGYGITEVGDITFESAGYCARYASKKLVHGNDDEHDYHPISKKSSKNAIGKKFLEKYWTDIFNKGYVGLATETGRVKLPIPRYYEKWLQKHHPKAWEEFVTTSKALRTAIAAERLEKLQEEINAINEQRLNNNWRKGFQQSVLETRKKIIEDKFNRLQSYLKGDI